MPGESRGGFAALGANPDEAERRIQEWAQGFADKAQRYQAVREQTEQLRLTAANSDGRIKVTVRADGSVVDLQFTDKVRQMQPGELAAQILATMHKAQADIANRVGAVMTENLGEEDQQTRTMMLDSLRERFPEQPDEPEPVAETSSKWDVPDDEPARESGPRSPQGLPQSPSPSTPNPPPNPPQRSSNQDDDYEDGDFGPDFDPLRD